MIVWCQPSSILPRRPPSSFVLSARPSVTETVSSAKRDEPGGAGDQPRDGHCG